MTRTHQVLIDLLERIPVWDLSVESRISLEGLKKRLQDAPDIRQELSHLYKVKGYGNFALSLLWVAEKVENDSTRVEASPDEELVVVGKFKEAAGVAVAAPPEQSFGMFGFPEAPAFTPSPFQTASPDLASAPDPFGFDGPSSSPADSMGGAPPSFGSFDAAPSTGGSPSAGGTEEEGKFSAKLERFLEAVQSGTDDREQLMAELKADCQSVIDGAQAEEFKQFCQMFSELLEYINVNQYLDDVRVMNLMTNIQEPFAQWAKSAPESRQGYLDPAFEMLRDFRSMFE